MVEIVVAYRDRVNAAVQTIGAQLGSPLSLDGHGILTLEFGNGRKCVLVVSETEQRVTLYASLAAVHGDVGKPLLEAALRANFDSARTDHGVIGYDEDRRELILTTSISGEVDAVRLASALDPFLRSARALAEKLQETARANRSASSDTPDDAGPSMLTIRP